MRTDDLVRTLAADTLPDPAPRARLRRGILVGAIVVAILSLPLLGFRPDPMAALTSGRVLLKQLFPVLLAAGAFGAALNLARPEGRVGRWGALLVAVPALLLAAVAAELAALPPAAWKVAMMGETSRFCLVWATLMALPPLAGALWGLRGGASTRPTLSGALAGLLAGGTGAALYAIHCTEDSPLFYAVWYVLAILVATAIGAVLGRFLLRW
jgi:hypothetical protein